MLHFEACNGYPQCTKCENGYSFLLDDKQKCVNTAEFLAKTNPIYFQTADNHLRECYNRCSKCSGVPEALKHNCKKCSDTFPYYEKKGDAFNCYMDCPNWVEDNSYKCVNSCKDISTITYEYPSEKRCVYNCARDNLFTVEETKQCVSECLYPFPYQLGDEKICVSTCPPDANYVIDNKCISSCEFKYYIDPTGAKKCIPPM